MAATMPTVCTRQHFQAAVWPLRCRQSPVAAGRTRQSTLLREAAMARFRAELLVSTLTGTFTVLRMVLSVGVRRPAVQFIKFLRCPADGAKPRSIHSPVARTAPSQHTLVSYWMQLETSLARR